jgi:hypothetical protein
VENEDWEEREISYGPEEESSPGVLGSRASWLPWVLWSLLPLTLLGIYFYLSRGPAEEPAPEPVVEAAEDLPSPGPPAPEEAEPPVDLPPLAESDALLRELLSQLTKHPSLAAFLVSEDLVRKIVVITANVAEGTSPRPHLVHVRPEERFTVTRAGGRTFLDPASYERYDAYAELFASVDTQGAAKLYRTLLPLFEEAHAELGLTDRKDFPDTLARAVAMLMATPAVEGPIALEPVSVSYAFEDPKLQSLTAAQKHLLRMGPSNTRKVQAKLAEISAALRLDSGTR